MNQKNNHKNSSSGLESKLNFVESEQSVKESGDGIYFTKSEVVELVQKAKEEVLEEGRKELAEEIGRTEEKINRIADDAKKEMAGQIQTDKISLITIFGVFASVLSFLTIEIQILKGLESSLKEKLGFSFVLGALLLIFPIALDYLVASRFNSAHKQEMVGEYMRLGIYVALVIVLFGTGIWFIG